jgi:hypothetical protein
MKTLWSIALVGFALLLGTGVPTEAAPSTFCGPGNTVVVTSPAGPNDLSPAQVEDGYNNNTCALTIKASIPINAGNSSVTFNAKSITVAGPNVGPPNPAIPPPQSTNVLIVNSNSNSTVILKAIDFVKIDKGSIKATKNVTIQCTAVGCPIDVTSSELIATETVTTAVNGGFGGPGGNLTVTANGNFTITTSTWTGGLKVKFTSLNGSVTAICAGGESTACKDPTVPPFLSQTIKDKCGDPPVFPCDLGVLDQAQVKNICIPDINLPLCDGGSAEKDFFAETLIDLHGSTMTTQRHIIIQSEKGPINAMDFHLIATGPDGALTMTVKTCTTTPCIDLRDADLDVAGLINIKVIGGCPAPPAISIDLTGATLKGSSGPLPIAGVTVNACNGAGVIAGP